MLLENIAENLCFCRV